MAATLLILVIVIVVIFVATRKKKVVYAQPPMGYPGTAPMGQGDYVNSNSMMGFSSSQPVVPSSESERPTEQAQNSLVADEILKLKNLMDSGVITAEEFEAQKKKLLG